MEKLEAKSSHLGPLTKTQPDADELEQARRGHEASRIARREPARV